MADRKTEMVAVFEDTRAYIKENTVLSESVNKSIAGSRLYAADEYPEIKRRTGLGGVEITVTQHRTFEAAGYLHKKRPEARICVLNFASPVNPGGGVKYGSQAQEESLCRCSTLYPVLNRRDNWRDYYDINRASDDPLGTDALIWTPGITVCKSDNLNPVRLLPIDFFDVDVITCAAPNLRRVAENEYTFLQLYNVHLQRARHIMHVAAAKGANVLVLGAFGCGAFRNTPNVVSQAWSDALPEYAGYFDAIEFAIYCSRRDTDNYDVFRHYIKIPGV